MESEGGERREKPTRKRKRAKTKVEMTRETEELRGVSPIRDQTPTTISGER